MRYHWSAIAYWNRFFFTIFHCLPYLCLSSWSKQAPKNTCSFWIRLGCSGLWPYIHSFKLFNFNIAPHKNAEKCRSKKRDRRPWVFLHVYTKLENDAGTQTTVILYSLLFIKIRKTKPKPSQRTKQNHFQQYFFYSSQNWDMIVLLLGINQNFFEIQAYFCNITREIQD